MERKIVIVTWMVENGYHLFDETVEQFAARFDYETLKTFAEKFSIQRKCKEMKKKYN